MSNKPLGSAIMVLQDGTVLRGRAAGFVGTCTGEICFNTGMTGYQEIFTDPSYYGQIIVMTNVHIGNYGTKEQESESSKVQVSGLVCRNFSEQYSRNLADSSLEDFLVQNKIVCIYDLDTRALVRHIRTFGSMNSIISSEILDPEKLKSRLDMVPSMEGLELSSQVSTTRIYDIPGTESATRLAVLDYGIKTSILKQLTAQHFYLRVFPAKTSFAELNEWKPDSFFLSNGPGDPAVMDYAIQTASQIINSGKPTFGICLGHQILGLAKGVKTIKMFHGHRGSNHPVKNLNTGLAEITSQNHGFAVDMEDLKKHKKDLTLTHINLNDQSVEGFSFNNAPIFSVQYHPEAGPGPHDSRYLFGQFSKLVQKELGIKQSS
ncbi:MAG: glutamine-hydrolyzing carbamoyl-phosphate synthase small subunit [Saprospiraceae bacterium]|nr:glutamine-hydrolyzing carbamoyl-phosphate synthase small subunit [Saprospiraceae bacterium]MBK9632530.1 glutamine-hydrolyzing carbamoyl-phosphate synthase small subunit [Saprospiraceae bacterium]